MGFAHDENRKKIELVAGTDTEPRNDPTDTQAADTSSDDPNTPPASEGSTKNKDYVGALRYHEAGTDHSETTPDTHLQQATGYEGSLRAAATFGASKVGEEKSLNLMGVVILSSILGLLTCILTLVVFVLFAGQV